MPKMSIMQFRNIYSLQNSSTNLNGGRLGGESTVCPQRLDDCCPSDTISEYIHSCSHWAEPSWEAVGGDLILAILPLFAVTRISLKLTYSCWFASVCNISLFYVFCILL